MRKSHLLLSFGRAALFAAALAACGDDDDDGSTGQASAAIGALCAKACECAAGGECLVVQPGGSAAIGFDSADDCKRQITALDDGSVNWGDCNAALAQASCIDAPGPPDAKPKGVESPAACNAP